VVGIGELLDAPDLLRLLVEELVELEEGWPVEMPSSTVRIGASTASEPIGMTATAIASVRTRTTLPAERGEARCKRCMPNPLRRPPVV
jgi:hypothetical protein